MTTWTGTAPTWDVTLTHSPEGNAAFTTTGLATHGLPDLVLFTEPDIITDQTLKDRAAELLICIADAVIQLGRIPTEADDFKIGAGTVPPWPMIFNPLPYVFHNITAALTGHAQTTALVEVHPAL